LATSPGGPRATGFGLQARQLPSRITRHDSMSNDTSPIVSRV
jgi:hypothetical protein